MNGRYCLSDELRNELLSVFRCSKKLAFSQETALYLNGIFDRTLFEHSVTVPPGSKPSFAVKSECKIYYIKPELFDLGKTARKTLAGNPVPSYDMEQTVCGAVRSRNKMGAGTFLAVLMRQCRRSQRGICRGAEHRKAAEQIAGEEGILKNIAASKEVRNMWEKYRKQFAYTEDIPCAALICSIEKLLISEIE